MIRHAALRLGALMSITTAAVTGCGDPPLLDLKVVLPEGANPLQGANRLRLVVTQPPAESGGQIGPDGKFAVDLKVEVAGAVGQVVLEAYAGDRLVARGETPPLSLRPEAHTLALLVGRSGDFSTLGQRLPSAGHGLSVVLLPSAGLLLAGGADQADRPLAAASLFDFFQQSFNPLPPMPGPRQEAVGAACGPGCALIALGATAAGLADKILRYQGGAWAEFADRLTPPDRRRGAGVALLSDGTYLIVGGEGPQGPADSALRLRPNGSGASDDPALEVLGRSRAPRGRPAVAGIGTVVLIVGGQPSGATPAELFYTASSSFQPLSLSGTAPASGSAVSELADGKLVIVGGRDETGNLLRDGWIVDPIAVKVNQVPGCLAEGRADHQLIRTGRQLVVVGGVTSSGAVNTVEVLGTDLVKASQGSLAAPRTGFAVGRLGPGAFLVAGGRPATGSAPTPLLEVFETGVASGR